MRELALSYGVFATMMAPRRTKDEFEHAAIESLLETGCFNPEDLIVIIGGSFGPSEGASFIEVSSAKIVKQETEII
jgi:pyruvate kinase